MATKELLTVKEFAKLAGVSVQSVYKGLNNRLNPWVESVGNQKMLRYEALREIYNIEVEQPIKPELNNILNQQTDVLTVLQKTIDTLQRQLEVKDRQIEKLETELTDERQHSRAQADKIAVLADQAQKLHLAQMKPAEISAGTDPAESEQRNENITVTVQKKESFISRLFKRK